MREDHISEIDATVECIIKDSANANSHSNAFKRLATIKCAQANIDNTFRNYKACVGFAQAILYKCLFILCIKITVNRFVRLIVFADDYAFEACTTEKHKIFNASYTTRYRYSRKTFAFPKCTVLNADYTVRYDYAYKVGTAAKQIVFDMGNTARDNDVRKACAKRKRMHSYIGYTFRNCYIRKVFTTKKCSFADARYGIGNRYACEIFTIFKRRIADARYGKSVISAYYDIGFGARVADTGYRVALAVLVKREYQTFSAFRIFFNVIPGCAV